MFTPPSSALIALFLSACLSAPDNPALDGERPPTRIDGPPDEFPTTFTVIRAVMALPDGRLIVSDPQENRIVLVDFSRGTSAQLGHIGEGPREYRQAGGLYRAPGGGVLILDQELRRLLPVSPEGRLQSVIALPALGAAGISLRGPDPIAPDSLGNAYSAIRSGGFTAPTSALLRYRPSRRPDTVTQLLRPSTKVLEEGANGMEYQEVLFSPEDAWVVAPDGRIAVVRVASYHVEWIPLDGVAVIGPTITHKPIPVTQADKELIASGNGGSLGRTSVSIGMFPAGGAPGSRAGVPAPISVGELRFAAVKTPVNLRGGRQPQLDAIGRLWVARNLPAGAKTTVFDVFDRVGNLVDRIELPTQSRLVGFDTRFIYTARLDADDFEHLQRFPLPP